MEKHGIVKSGLIAFGLVNLGYIGYALYKNFKDYKNKEGEYAEEQPEQLDLFDATEADAEIVSDKEVVEPTPRRSEKKKSNAKLYIGIGLLATAVIGGYCYGYRSAWVKRSNIAAESEELLHAVIDDRKDYSGFLEQELINREIDLGVERETIVSNAINMIHPDYMDTRWVSFSEDGTVRSNYTPKVTEENDLDTITTAVEDTWNKLYEKVVVTPMSSEKAEEA
nr:MAG TPA: hypothetical protein [Caudoviricetes sp.]